MLVNLIHHIARYRLNLQGFESRFTEINSCRLHYLDRPAINCEDEILFIHGLGTSSSTWVKILPRLDVPAAIRCIDLPGYGYSRILSDSRYFSLEQLDLTLEKFVKREYSRPITVIGHSLGGWLAARLALKDPAAVKRLILINNAGIEYPGVEKQKQAFELHKIRDVRKLLHMLWYGYLWYMEPFTPFIYNYMKVKCIDQFIMGISAGDFLNNSFSSLSMPLDVVWGKEDKLISIESVEIMKKLKPSITVHFINDCGHVPQLERPIQLADILKKILL